MLGGYFLRGIQDDHILVFRTDDPEDILRLITRLKASRDKEIKALAEILEMQWFEREYKNKETKKKSEF